jgi:hypothetical protein
MQDHCSTSACTSWLAHWCTFKEGRGVVLSFCLRKLNVIKAINVVKMEGPICAFAQDVGKVTVFG